MKTLPEQRKSRLSIFLVLYLLPYQLNQSNSIFIPAPCLARVIADTPTSRIWSWAPGEPRNSSSSSYTTTASTESLFRCATSSKDQLGRWIVEDCSEKRYAACRARGQPYNVISLSPSFPLYYTHTHTHKHTAQNPLLSIHPTHRMQKLTPKQWTLASVQVSYSFAGENCPSGYDFAVPRTALENTYRISPLPSPISSHPSALANIKTTPTLTLNSDPSPAHHRPRFRRPRRLDRLQQPGPLRLLDNGGAECDLSCE